MVQVYGTTDAFRSSLNLKKGDGPWAYYLGNARRAHPFEYGRSVSYPPKWLP